jgi:hypothetical protein
VDDSDPSTWKPHTRFLEVAPSLSHTAHSQVEGEKLLAMKVAAAFTNCPSSKAAGISMSWQDWFRKELAQMSDHANDQKAKKDEKDDLKHQILIEDLGSQEAEALSIEELLDALLAISQDEIEEKSGKSFDELYVFSHSSVHSSVQQHRSLPCSTEGERASITRSIVDTQLGEDTFDALSDDLKALADFFLFGGESV